MGDTPNYLGFAELAAKTGTPFERMVKGALTTYGEVQDLKQKTYATSALPKKLEQEEQGRAQQLEKGATEAKYYPKQLEQEESARALDIAQKQTILKYLPRTLRGKITAQDLENIHQGLQNKISGMSIEQMNEQIAQGEFSKVYQARLDSDHPNAAQKQWELSRKKLAANGVDITALPEKLDDNVIAMGKAALQQQQIASPLVQKLIEIRAENAGKAHLEEIKQVGELQSAYDKRASALNAEYFEQELPDQQQTARSIIDRVRNVRNLVKNHEWSVGPVAGRAGEIATPEIGEAVMDMNTIVADMLGTIKGASRGGKMYIDFAKSMKPSQYDRPATLHRKLNNLEAVNEILDEEAKFGEYVSSFGVRSKSQVANSWDKFLESQNFKDKKGNIVPGKANQWMQYFDQHPEDLPRGIHTRMADEGAPIAAPQPQVAAPQGAPQLPTPPPKAPVAPSAPAQGPQIFGVEGITSPLFNGGIIPDFNPSKLLGG